MVWLLQAADGATRRTSRPDLPYQTTGEDWPGTVPALSSMTSVEVGGL